MKMEELIAGTKFNLENVFHILMQYDESVIKTITEKNAEIEALKAEIEALKIGKDS